MELFEREPALRTLGGAYDSAVAGRGRAVFVAGEPGIGKTAVVDAFVASLAPGARVLVGACDDLSIARPLGPFRDLIGSVSCLLGEAIERDAPPHQVIRLLVDELARPPTPTVLVVEDAHWADEATIDVLTVLARQLGTQPVLLLVTFRPGETSPAFETALGSVARTDAAFIELEPLSRSAVAEVAGERADEVYAATRGNPFFVSELTECAGCDQLPRSIASAVVGRAATLADDSRELLELISVVPGRASTAVLDAAAPAWAQTAEEPERRRLLELRGRHVRFRHELARRAIESSLPATTRRRLHARVLAALLESAGDPADIVHHAEAAGAEEVVGEYALVAARRAAAVESNREAFAHYHRALDFLELLPLHQQAGVLEETAHAAYVVNRPSDAFGSIYRAREIHEALADVVGVGRCTRILSRLHWFVGDGSSARTHGEEAVRILEPLGDSSELARAYSGMSQLAMLEEDSEKAFAWGERALALAATLGDEQTRAHALVNIGTTKVQLDPDDVEPLLEAHVVADRAGDPEEGTRALGNLAYTQLIWGRPSAALEHAGRALEYAYGHEVHHLAAYNATTVAWLKLRGGQWEEAEADARRFLLRGDTIPELYARIVLTELAVRRGDADAEDQLAQLAAEVERTGEAYRMTPVAELMVERALWTRTTPPHRLLADLRSRARSGSEVMRLTAWAAVLGEKVELTKASKPYASMQRGDWAGAADAFGEIGWTYDRALMLSLLRDGEALAESIAIARDLGAAPLSEHASRRMRELGLRIPRGPRRGTRDNPAQLTDRQLEVLTLLVEGRTNVEIADRLVVSARTAEHHVAAVLAKLGARDRRQAARRAVALGL